MRTATIFSIIYFLAYSKTASGAVYTSWGRKDCPSGSSLVYTGSAGGSDYNHQGASTNTLCLPKEPEYGSHTTSAHGTGYVVGTEYETHNQLPEFNHLYNQDVPCTVCRTRSKDVLMIPAKKSCPQGGFLEYTGYLMGGNHAHPGTADYICVDRAAQALNSGYKDTNGHLLYLVEGWCGTLPCPPYKHTWELTCVVCSQ